MATKYMRADGTASVANAIGPETDAAACMSADTHNGGTFSASDIIMISALGGDYAIELRPPTADVTYTEIGVPIFSGANAQCCNVLAKDDITIGAITTKNGTSRHFRIENNNNLIIDGAIVDSFGNNLFGIRAAFNTGVVKSGLDIINCDISSQFETGNCFYAVMVSETCNDINVSDNNFLGSKVQCLLHGTELTTGVNDWAPKNVTIKDNLFNGSFSDAIKVVSGIGWDTTEAGRSVISGNTINNTGAADSANTNGVGLQWCIGVIFESNTITDVNTSVPDGHGLILDWAYTSDTYICSDVIVRTNEISGCDSNIVTAGIRVFKATDTIVNNNLCINNTVGASVGNPESTGNKFYNNTLANNSANSFRADTLGGGNPTGTVAMNNIFYKGEYNVLLANGVGEADITLTTNCYFGATTEARYDSNASATFAAEAGAIEADPLFIDAANGNYNLQQSSPCVGVGTKWWGLAPRPESLSGEPLPDVKIDLGAYQSTYDPNHPVNL